jgi:hypothetical protein
MNWQSRSLPNLTAGHALSGSADARNDEMETMSQFANEKDLWKARCLRMARALSAVMDRTHDHDIQAATGLPNCQCERIAEARADAEEIIGDEMRQGRLVT